MRQSFSLLLYVLITCSAFSQGVTKNGQVTSTGSILVNENGAIGASTGIDKNGKKTSSLAIGSNYQGGKIFYFFVAGDPGYVAGETHGLIAAPSDLTDTKWECDGTEIIGTRSEIGYGKANTDLIRAACPATGGAAEVCDNLVLNSYTDWYLPSLIELLQLADNQVIIGGFAGAGYFSSTQFVSSSAFNRKGFASAVYFANNSSSAWGKGVVSKVRAIRSF